MKQESTLASSLVAGAVAGLLATAPMTLTMQKLHQQLPWYERYPLPPRQIVERVTQAVGVRTKVDRQTQAWLTLLAHFGYGAAAGAVYAPLARALRPQPVLGGIAFGMLVWSASYLGLLPALGILRPATKHPARRNALMIGAHGVWGAALGLLVEYARRWKS